MNILYIGDPNSIHDVRWINFFAGQDAIRCFIVSRSVNFVSYHPESSFLNKNVKVLSPIGDPSTVRPWSNWYNARCIRKIIVKHQIDILHILYAEPNSLWTNWKWLFRVPVVITTHGTDVLKTIPRFFQQPGILNRIISRQYRKAFGLADHVTCTSLLQMKSLRRMKVAGPITIVRTGVDFSTIEKSKQRNFSTADFKKPVVLMPRNMKAIYQHELTLEAIGLLNENIRNEFCFVFVDSQGSDHLYFSNIRDKADKVNADIRFLPALQHVDLLSLMHQSALVVMNPRSDGSPVTAMESMALLVPVILPPLDYDSDVFANAWFFREWSAVSLKNKIEEVLTGDHKTIMQRVTDNFERISRHGNIDVEMNKLAFIYTELARR